MQYLDVNIDVNTLARQIGDAISQVNKAAQPLLIHGWEVYVRQQFISGLAGVIINLAFLIPVLVTGIIFLPRLYRWAKDYKYENRENDGAAFILPSIFTFIVVVVFVISVFNIVNGAMHMLNPEYYAFQDILQQTGISH